MSYRRAWLLVEEINNALREPAVTAETGGRSGGGAALTAVVSLKRSMLVGLQTIACRNGEGSRSLRSYFYLMLLRCNTIWCTALL
jgi:hypothetical protein